MKSFNVEIHFPHIGMLCANSFNILRSWYNLFTSYFAAGTSTIGSTTVVDSTIYTKLKCKQLFIGGKGKRSLCQIHDKFNCKSLCLEDIWPRGELLQLVTNTWNYTKAFWMHRNKACLRTFSASVLSFTTR